MKGLQWHSRKQLFAALPFCLAPVLAFAAAAVGPAVAAPLYRYVDSQGTIHFSDYQRTPAFELLILHLKDKRSLINTAIRAVAERHKIPVELVQAVIHTESSYRPEAISPVGAMGLMQLMPDTAAALNVTNPLDIEENLEGGVTYLKKMLVRFKGKLPVALAAYNAGPTAVAKHNGIPPFPETKNYVNKVLKWTAYYRQQKGP